MQSLLPIFHSPPLSLQNLNIHEKFLISSILDVVNKKAISFFQSKNTEKGGVVNCNVFLYERGIKISKYEKHETSP